jgi:hypothetical protein
MGSSLIVRILFLAAFLHLAGDVILLLGDVQAFFGQGSGGAEPSISFVELIADNAYRFALSLVYFGAAAVVELLLKISRSLEGKAK